MVRSGVDNAEGEARVGELIPSGLQSLGHMIKGSCTQIWMQRPDIVYTSLAWALPTSACLYEYLSLAKPSLSEETMVLKKMRSSLGVLLLTNTIT